MVLRSVVLLRTYLFGGHDVRWFELVVRVELLVPVPA